MCFCVLCLSHAYNSRCKNTIIRIRSYEMYVYMSTFRKLYISYMVTFNTDALFFDLNINITFVYRTIFNYTYIIRYGYSVFTATDCKLIKFIDLFFYTNIIFTICYHANAFKCLDNTIIYGPEFLIFSNEQQPNIFITNLD